MGILATAPTLASGVTDFLSIVSTIMSTIKGDEFLLVYLVAPAVSIGITALRKMVGRM